VQKQVQNLVKEHHKFRYTNWSQKGKEEKNENEMGTQQSTNKR
jgi:hypothetical protein